MASGKPEPYRLGFLTAIDLPDRGFVGGLLVTNHFGRPLEFQCTLPVRPNATQVMLYGPTLGPFLLGELIGATLLEKSGIKPQLVLVDREAILSVREHCETPVVYVPQGKRKKKAATEETSQGDGVVQASSTDVATALHGGVFSAAASSEPSDGDEPERATGPGTLKLGRQIVRFHASHPTDRDRVMADSQQIAQEVDLHEPFDRVREALQETLKAAGSR